MYLVVVNRKNKFRKIFLKCLLHKNRFDKFLRKGSLMQIWKSPYMFLFI